MDSTTISTPLHILMVEDNPGDVLLTREVMKKSRLFIHLDHVDNSVELFDFLNQRGDFNDVREPDIILLDLNLPGDNGHKILAELKETQHLKHIPVVMLTSSEREEDVLTSYNLGANCYVSKPVGLEQFEKIVNSLEEFWFTIVKLPPKLR